MTPGGAPGAQGGRKPSRSGDQWRTVTKRDNGHFRELPGQGQERPGNGWRPQQDSNLRSRLRRPLLSPLSYGGYATGKRVPAESPARTRGGTAPDAIVRVTH
jgi:hypothetical protein